MITAGELDQRLDILVEVPSESTLGGVELDWRLLRTVHARQMEGLAKEFVAGGVVEQGRASFKLRWSQDLQDAGAKMRAGWRGRLWEVTGMTGTRRSGELWLQCKDVGVYDG